MKKIAGILAGCGYLDGAEIQEAVLTALAFERRGFQLSWFAPDQPQHHQVDHLSGQTEPGPPRNVLHESARIVRGRILPLEQLDVAGSDALVLPGGFGVAKNLCSFAFAGADMSVLPLLERIVLDFHQARKPMGFICIAPVIAARVLGLAHHVPTVTIGDHEGTIQAIQSWSARHQVCAADEICVDGGNLLVSTPAWNCADSIVQVSAGIEKLAGRLSQMM